MDTNNKVGTYAERRNNFMETYKNDPVLSKQLPEVAAGLMKAEFGINIPDHSHFPIIFTVGWTEILKQLGSERAEECKVDVCGIQLEYVTEFTDSDKTTNIVPQMYHVKTPLFQQREKETTIGASFTDSLLAKYNAWRSVYALEALTSVENKAFETILKDFGINLMVPAAIYPIIGAAQTAGITLARQLKRTINMYNIYEIDVVEGDKVIITPLAYVKQWLKNDSKK